MSLIELGKTCVLLAQSPHKKMAIRHSVRFGGQIATVTDNGSRQTSIQTKDRKILKKAQSQKSVRIQKISKKILSHSIVILNKPKGFFSKEKFYLGSESHINQHKSEETRLVIKVSSTLNEQQILQRLWSRGVDALLKSDLQEF